MVAEGTMVMFYPDSSDSECRTGGLTKVPAIIINWRDEEAGKCDLRVLACTETLPLRLGIKRKQFASPYEAYWNIIKDE